MALKRDRKVPVEPPTSSLADIAFLLLVFFLVTTTVDVDKGLSLSLPEKGQVTEVRKKNIANLLINATGQVMLNEEPIELNMVRERARLMMQENPLIIFSVKTDQKTKYDVYIDVIDQLKQANATRISIAEPES
ncbi:MAG TPA: biopolymer transporter ExbD [bacterium]|jgi:biopolymer transport protein ExbD|nr:biopolymer transporter ExbD [bacterium]HNT64262.1 biopolymer transporter ExbD [bacterium]HOX85252.1 biopolymer transporter ExbD [bacterium]HPG44411.1 biopolymer transporter ExbD [bacterium]HPM96969.1 biopolymer transporter ExbD [bacterium]